MANLTITVDAETLRRARIRALEQGTSVNAILAEYLSAFAGETEQRRQALDDLLKLSREATSGSAGKRITREELHERR